MTSWGETRKIILKRDNEKCRRCGGVATDVHHRKAKGMGGSKRLDYPANLISLCRTCHAHVHAHPTESYATGYLVHSWDDPDPIPIGPCDNEPLF